MINCIVIAESTLMQCTLADMLDMERDIRICWRGAAQALSSDLLATLPPAVAVIDGGNAVGYEELHAALKGVDVPSLLLQEQGDSPDAYLASRRICNGCALLPSPFGRGHAAWREFQSVFGDTVRRLASTGYEDLRVQERRGAASAEGPRPPRVLLVADGKGTRLTLSQILSNAGYEVEVADDDAAVSDALAGRSFEIVLTDLSLPRQSGMKLLRDLRRGTPMAHVILMTDKPTDKAAGETKRLGVFDYIAKPVSREALLDSVSLALRTAPGGEAS